LLGFLLVSLLFISFKNRRFASINEKFPFKSKSRIYPQIPKKLSFLTYFSMLFFDFHLTTRVKAYYNAQNLCKNPAGEEE